MLSKEDFEAYCKEYYTIVYKYCYKRLSNKEDAEDATQQAFLIFYTKCSLLEREHIKAWLLTTAHHMVLKEYKRRSRTINKECLFDEEMTELSKKVRSFEEDLIDYYAEKYIDEIYSRLSIKEKELFDLYSDGNIKTAEIAKIMGLEPHACSMRKKRLIEKCRDIMLEILFY